MTIAEPLPPRGDWMRYWTNVPAERIRERVGDLPHAQQVWSRGRLALGSRHASR